MRCLALWLHWHVDIFGIVGDPSAISIDGCGLQRQTECAIESKLDAGDVTYLVAAVKNKQTDS